MNTQNSLNTEHQEELKGSNYTISTNVPFVQNVAFSYEWYVRNTAQEILHVN
jgi:hypothetical protein